jgi:hypothetical protein
MASDDLRIADDFLLISGQCVEKLSSRRMREMFLRGSLLQVVKDREDGV